MSGVSEHPHAGRIAAVGYYSAACALLERGKQALRESGFDMGGQNAESDAIGRAFFELEQAADEVMRPCEVANVLQTVEEVLARGTMPAGLQFLSGNESGRAEIVRWLVDGRHAANEEALMCERCGEHPAATCECDEEPGDDALANGHGMEGGIGYHEPGDTRDAHAQRHDPR